MNNPNPKSLSELRAEDEKKREEWLAKRREGVGASETAGVLGVSPWASPLSVYADKVTTERDAPLDDAAIERQRWGHLLERVILDELSARTGLRFRRAPQTRMSRHRRWPSVPIFATPDAYVIEAARRLAQVKTTAVWNKDEWAEGVPLHVTVQAQSEMAVCDREANIVVALIGGQELVWSEIARHEKFIEQLEPEIMQFWFDYVQRRRLPPADGKTCTVRALERLHPDDNGLEVMLDERATQIDKEIADIKSDLGKLEGRKKELENEIKAMIGGATWGKLPNGAGRFSWKTIERAAYQAKAAKYRQLRRGK